MVALGHVVVKGADLLGLVGLIFLAHTDIASPPRPPPLLESVVVDLTVDFEQPVECCALRH